MFKVLLVGQGRCGKSSLIKRVKGAEFDKKYVPTVGVEVHPLVFNTSKGKVTLYVWDCAGQEKFMGIKDGYYYTNADAAIVCYKGKKKATMAPFIADVIRLAKLSVHIVSCQMKCDKLTLDKYNDNHCHASSQDTRFNVPFIEVMRKLLKDDSLVLLDDHDEYKALYDSFTLKKLTTSLTSHYRLTRQPTDNVYKTVFSSDTKVIDDVCEVITELNVSKALVRLLIKEQDMRHTCTELNNMCYMMKKLSKSVVTDPVVIVSQPDEIKIRDTYILHLEAEVKRLKKAKIDAPVPEMDSMDKIETEHDLNERIKALEKDVVKCMSSIVKLEKATIKVPIMTADENIALINLVNKLNAKTPEKK